jgi:hypothetical protein
MMRCRPGIVTDAEPGAIPDQRCTTSLRFVLHRIRETESAGEESRQHLEHRVRLLQLRQVAGARDHLDPRA